MAQGCVAVQKNHVPFVVPGLSTGSSSSSTNSSSTSFQQDVARGMWSPRRASNRWRRSRERPEPAQAWKEVNVEEITSEIVALALYTAKYEDLPKNEEAEKWCLVDADLCSIKPSTSSGAGSTVLTFLDLPSPKKRTPHLTYSCAHITHLVLTCDMCVGQDGSDRDFFECLLKLHLIHAARGYVYHDTSGRSLGPV